MCSQQRFGTVGQATTPGDAARLAGRCGKRKLDQRSKHIGLHRMAASVPCGKPEITPVGNHIIPVPRTSPTPAEYGHKAYGIFRINTNQLVNDHYHRTFVRP